ncbi:MAG: hypothetical protein EBV03_07730 [Proteobacteria bacterium]|nr:hypothetical protein [Pseudomonadota bacterium]
MKTTIFFSAITATTVLMANMALADITNLSGNRSVGTTSTSGTTSNTTTSTTSSSPNNWESQSTYWRSNYSSRPYYNRDKDFSMYEPAYRYGTELYNENKGRPYAELESERLSNGWTTARGSSTLNWNEAQLATQDAYNRMYEMNRTTTTSQQQ